MIRQRRRAALPPSMPVLRAMRPQGLGMTPRYCPACEARTTDPTCWLCGDPGSTDPRTFPQRSWNGEDAAYWSAMWGWEGVA